MSTFNKHCWHHAGVSKNNGAPKSSIWIGFSVINHPFWGIPIFGNTHAFDPIWIKTRDLWCRCHIGNRRRKCRNRRLYRCCDGNPKVWHDSFGRFGRRQCPTRSSEELVYIYIYMTPLHFHFSTLGQMDQLIQVVCEVQLPKGKTCGHQGHLEIETSPHTPIGGGGVVVDELWLLEHRRPQAKRNAPLIKLLQVETMTPLHFHFSTLGQMDQLIQVVCEVQLPKGKTCGHQGHLEIETSPHTA